MRLYILHITSNCSKLEVFTSAEQAKLRYDSFYDHDADPSLEENPHWIQNGINRYQVELEGYEWFCEQIDCPPSYSLWFIEGVDHIVEYKDIHNYLNNTQGA